MNIGTQINNYDGTNDPSTLRTGERKMVMLWQEKGLILSQTGPGFNVSTVQVC